jgi:hypothetical protein
MDWNDENFPAHDQQILEFLERIEKIRHHQDKVLTGRVAFKSVRKPARQPAKEPESLLSRFRDWIEMPENRPNDTYGLAGPEWLKEVNARFEQQRDTYPMAAQHKKEYEEEMAIWTAYAFTFYSSRSIEFVFIPSKYH